MQDIQGIIKETVNETIFKLRLEDMLKDGGSTPERKTEQLLKKYLELKSYCQLDEEKARRTKRLVKNIESSLEIIKNDKYYKIIPLFYFESKSRENIAEHFNVDEKTITRNKSILIKKLASCLYTDDMLRDVFK